MKKIAIIQARMSSVRLPGKVLELINGEPMIFWQLERLAKSNKIQDFLVVTSTDKSDDQLYDYLSNLDVPTYHGSLNDVADRFYNSVVGKDLDYFIRLTADCPLVMPKLLDQMITDYEAHPTDYFSNILELTYPDRLDIEFVRSSAFNRLVAMPLSIKEKEHVTLGLYSRPHIFSLRNYGAQTNLKDHRWTVDTADDLEFIRRIFNHFKGRETEFTVDEIITAQTSDSALVRLMPR